MPILSALRERFFGLAHRLSRGTAGTEDPNIVGDAGPFDQPPGRDPAPSGPSTSEEAPGEGRPR